MTNGFRWLPEEFQSFIRAKMSLFIYYESFRGHYSKYPHIFAMTYHMNLHIF